MTYELFIEILGHQIEFGSVVRHSIIELSEHEVARSAISRTLDGTRGVTRGRGYVHEKAILESRQSSAPAPESAHAH